MSSRNLLVIGLLAIAGSSAGCTVAWTGSISLEPDPTALLQLQRPLPPAPPAVPSSTYSPTLGGLDHANDLSQMQDVLSPGPANRLRRDALSCLQLASCRSETPP